jgi:hypothetical protein
MKGRRTEAARRASLHGADSSSGGGQGQMIISEKHLNAVPFLERGCEASARVVWRMVAPNQAITSVAPYYSW